MFGEHAIQHAEHADDLSLVTCDGGGKMLRVIVCEPERLAVVGGHLGNLEGHPLELEGFVLLCGGGDLAFGVVPHDEIPKDRAGFPAGRQH